MKNRKIVLVILSVVISLVTVFTVSSIDLKASTDLNAARLLTITQIGHLIEENDIELQEVKSVPFDVSQFVMFEKMPTIYQSGKCYIMIYQFDQYHCNKDIMDWTFDAPYTYKHEFIPAAYIAGKNIVVTWVMESKSLTEGRGTPDYENYVKLRENIWDILFIDAFNGKKAIYEGESDNWQVVIPIKYYENRDSDNWELGSDKSISGTPMFRYKNGSNKEAKVSMVSMGQEKSWNQKLKDPEGKIFDGKNQANIMELPAMKITDSTNLDENIMVTVKWQDGTETIELLIK